MTSNVRQATEAAEAAAVAAAGLTGEIERYEYLASQRRQERVALWAAAQAGGMSYARIGALSDIHSSKVHEAVVEHRAATRRSRAVRAAKRRRAS